MIDKFIRGCRPGDINVHNCAPDVGAIRIRQWSPDHNMIQIPLEYIDEFIEALKEAKEAAQ